MPKMSVIMPVYNTNPEYLNFAMESIMHQTFKDIEIIVVDDCSNLSTVKLLRQFYERDKRIKLYRNDKNCGVAYSLNKGMAVVDCNSKYIVRMDSDDISLNDRLEHQYQFMEKYHDIDFCSANVEYIDSDGKRLFKIPRYRSSKSIMADLVFRCSIYHPTVVIRKHSVEHFDKLYDEGSKCEDYRLWIKLRMNGLKYKYSHKKVLLYRKHAQQITQQKIAEMLNENISIVNQYLLWLGLETNLEKTASFVRYMSAYDVTTTDVYNFKEIFSHLLNIQHMSDNEKLILRYRSKLIYLFRLGKRFVKI